MPPLTLATALETWQFALAPAAALTLLAIGYLAGMAAVARRHPARPWPVRRALAFGAGLGVVAVATQGSPAAYDALLTAHMAQHLLLIMVAPALLVTGRPVTLALHAVRGRWHSRVKRMVRSPALAALTWPPFTVALYTAVVAATHLTALIGARGLAHDAEHVAYLACGYLLFLVVAGGEPIRWRLSPFGRYLLLLAAMPADIGTGAALMLRSGVAGYPAADVRAAGLVMLAGGEAIMTALAIGLAVPVIRDAARDHRDARAAAAGELAAYNASLAALSPSGRPGRRRSPGPPRAGRRPDTPAPSRCRP